MADHFPEPQKPDMDETIRSYDEILDLLARGSSPEELLAFHPSERTQARVRNLLERSKMGELTDQESLEMQRFGQLEHLIQLIKARAQFYADQHSCK